MYFFVYFAFLVNIKKNFTGHMLQYFVLVSLCRQHIEIVFSKLLISFYYTTLTGEYQVLFFIHIGH
jgi:hypothetical protein